MCGGGGQRPQVYQQQAAQPPTRKEAQDATAVQKEKKRLLNKMGRKSTILTSSLGIGEDPNVGKKTLLGS